VLVTLLIYSLVSVAVFIVRYRRSKLADLSSLSAHAELRAVELPRCVPFNLLSAR
jgi:hypothetical protein